MIRRALSLYQPWGWLMLYGPKRIENRGWKPPPAALGERVYVHQGKKWDEDGAAYIRKNMPAGFEFPELARTSGILGSFEITGYLDKEEPGAICPRGQEVWFFGRYGWITADPRPLEVLGCSVPWPGSLGLWKVPDELQKRIDGWDDYLAQERAKDEDADAYEEAQLRKLDAIKNGDHLENP